MDEEIAPGVAVREVSMQTARRKHTSPRWEVRREGTLIGWVDEHHFSNASSTFYFAVGIDLDTGKQYRLEGDTNRRERLGCVVAFQTDPTYRELIMSRGRYSGSDT